jgi:hypothetical protein
MNLNTVFEQVLKESDEKTEYENICKSFKKISALFIKYFSYIGSSYKNEDLMSESKIRSLKEIEKADNILMEIKNILVVNTENSPSLISRIRNYRERYINSIIDINEANPLTQSLILSLAHVFNSYTVNSNKFDDEDERLFIRNLLKTLKDYAKELNDFLLEHSKRNRQPQPLYTIFEDESANHLNTQIIPNLNNPLNI